MKKIGWYAVSTVVAVFIVGGVLLLAANLYVQSRAVQHRIRQALGSGLRMPVSIKKTTFTPWEGLRIDGASAHGEFLEAAAAKTDGSAFLTAASFRVRFAFFPLFRGRLVIKDVLIDRPQLAWAQDGDDRWRLPPNQPPIHRRKDEGLESAPSTAATPPHANTDPALPLTSPALSPRAAGTEASDDNGQTIPRLFHPTDEKIQVDKFRLRGGNLSFLNHKRGLLGRFEGVDVDGRLTGLDHAEGFARFGKATLPRAGIKLTNLASHFVYDQKLGLDLDGAQAQFAGGKISAGYHMRTDTAGSPFRAQCRLENVNLAQLIKEAGGRFGLVEGRLHGDLDVSGLSDDPTRSEAAGQLQLVDTQLHNLPLFQTVGTVLHIEDLRQMRFKKAQVNYSLEGTTLCIQPLILASNDLQISAQGNYFLQEDRLELHARLVIDEAVSKQLPQMFEQQFKPCGDEAPGSRFIDFDIGGPLNKPTNNLYQRILPDALNGLLDGLMHGRPKHAKPKPHPNEEPTASPLERHDTPET